MKICVVIPTYNEQDNIIILVKKILKLGVSGLGIIVVDDNSPDGTGKIADRLARKYQNVKVIHRQEKQGLGTAYIEGWQKALKLGAKIIFGMDGDGSHDPGEIPKMLRVLHQADVVVGSRHVPGGKIIGFNWFRILLTSAAQLFCRRFLGITVRDSTSSFRGYRREVLEKIQQADIKSSGYSFLIEVLFRTQRMGFRIAEVPITFGVRNGGKSKISQNEILKALRTVFRLRFPARP